MKIPKIRQLPSGAYTCQLRVNGQSISITDERRDVVEAKAYAYKSGLMAAQTSDGGNLTLGQAIDLYIESRKNTLSPSTIRGYRIIQDNRFSQLMSKKISTLNVQVCQRACNDEAKHYSPKTLSNSWGFVRSVIKECGGQEINVRLPQKIKKERAFLAPEEIPVFIKAIKGSDAEIPALLALSSLRTSEILALTYSSIDLKNKRIKVSGAVVPDENNNLVKKATNKTASSTRQVPIFIPELAEALEKAIKDHRLNDPITLMTHNTMYDRINTVCERNELPRVGVHGLRHSFASLAYSLGVPELVAMQIGGWSDYGTMRKIYTHIAESQRTKNVDKLQLFFEKNTADC